LTAVVAPRHFERDAETAPREEIQGRQLDGLARFLAQSAARSEFHRRRAAAAGVDLETVRSLEQLSALPLMRKQDVLDDLAAAPPFGTLLAVGAHEIAHYVETSGTSGHGHERYVLTREDLTGLRRQEAFGFVWAGVTPGSFVATTYPMTAKAAGRWHALGAEAAGGVYLPLGGVEAAAKLDYLTRLPVETVIATPSYVHRLESEATRLDIRLADLRVRALMISGETFDEAWVGEREEIWGARVYEQYGSSQRCMVWSCEEGAVTRSGLRGVLHCTEHLAVYEVLDPDTGRHVEPGEFGEMVVTPFSSSRGMPLVRFASGDRVRYLGHGTCPCGREFVGLEAGTISRYDERLRIKGVNLEPESIDPLVIDGPVIDYDGVLAIDDLGREMLTIRVETRHDVTLDSAALESLATRLRAATGVRFDVEQSAGPLPRDAQSGKRKRWHDLRNR
jgi:phenylacetate-CoA ligase